MGPRSRGRDLQERIGRGALALLKDGFVGRGEAGPVAHLSLLFIHVMVSCLFRKLVFSYLYTLHRSSAILLFPLISSPYHVTAVFYFFLHDHALSITRESVPIHACSILSRMVSHLAFLFLFFFNSLINSL